MVKILLLLIYKRLRSIKIMNITILKREISLTDFKRAGMPHKRYNDPFDL